MFNNVAELQGKGDQCSPTPWATFSTDLDVSAVYQVKTPERTQAGNLNEEARLTREGEKKPFAIWFHIMAKRVGHKECMETTRGSGTQLLLTLVGDNDEGDFHSEHGILNKQKDWHQLLMTF